jgi:phosphoenolpyruvate phosphomutase
VAMRDCAETLHREQSLLSMEDRIAPVKEIFRLQGASELQDAEGRYLPQRGETARVIVLAASRGAALGALTEDKPKTMVEVAGQPLLAQIIAAYNASGIKNISVVRGYKADAVNLQGVDYVDNTAYADTGELMSLKCALDADADDDHDLYISFGDVLFKRYIVESLAEPEDDFVLAVDTDWQESVNRGRAADYVSCSEPYSRSAFNSRVLLADAGEELAESAVHGEWTGIMRVAAAGMPRFRALVNAMADDPANRKAKLHHVLAALTANKEDVRVVYTTGHWLDVDSVDDVVAAGNFT